MIKTDKVVYRTRTQEEYDWLMEKLEKDGFEWSSGNLPTAPEVADNWIEYLSETCIDVNDGRIVFADFDFYKNKLEYIDYEFIEVSDLMEDENKAEILEKLETLDEHLEDELKKIEKGDDEQQKIKKIVYTTEVYFE